MEIVKAIDPDSEWLISDPGNYEAKINRIGIPHGRIKIRAEASTEDEQSSLRSALWKLMWISRVGRQGAIYDDSATAGTFNEWKIGDSQK